MAKSASKDQQQDKKRQILDAAMVMLRDKGLQDFSFESVAREANLSRQLLRYYFPDPQALIAELCDHLANGYRDALVAGIVEIGEIERLDFFLDYFFDLADGHPMPDNLEVYDALIAYSVGSPELAGRMCNHYQTLGQVIVHELAIAHPGLDGRACEELAYLFVTIMHAHWSFVASLGYCRDHSRLARAAIDRLIASYVNDSTPTAGLERIWARSD